MPRAFRCLAVLTLLALPAIFLPAGCESGGDKPVPSGTTDFPLGPDESGLNIFDVQPKGGYSLARDPFGRLFALVPKGKEIPEGVTASFPPTSIIRVPVERVVVASGTYDPGLIIALGKGDTIIGSSDPEAEWDLPEMIKRYREGKVRFVGYFNALDYENIVRMSPELVLASSPGMVADLNYLGLAAIGTYNNFENDIDSYLRLLAFMGALFGAEEEAALRVSDIKTALSDIRAKVRDLEQPKFTWGTYWDKRVFVLSSHYWLTELMTLCGGDYVFGDSGVGNVSFSLEEFLVRSGEADIYFASYGHDPGPETLEDLIKKSPDLSGLRAFAERGMVVMTEPILWQESGQMDKLAYEMAALFHPEVYPQRNLEFIRILSNKTDIPFKGRPRGKPEVETEGGWEE
ncbi:MAG: ABC transporter substrate-binding protein [Deltaproteobacteria bacterium]|nr:ABC transporter substrate-binding protein [Deltaproteobacteria bacterium]